MGMLMRETYRG